MTLGESYYHIVPTEYRIDSVSSKIYANRVLLKPRQSIEIKFKAVEDSILNHIKSHEFLICHEKDTVLIEKEGMTLYFDKLKVGKHIISPIFKDDSGDLIKSEDLLIDVSVKKSHLLNALNETIENKKLEEREKLFKTKHNLLFVWKAHKIVIVSLLSLLVIFLIILGNRRSKQNQLTKRLKKEKEEQEHTQNKSDEAIMSKSESKISYEELLAENERLKAENALFKNQIQNIEKRTQGLKDENAILSQNVAKLSSKKDELEALQKQKDDILALMLHDIKNPISIIKSLVELLTSYDISANDQKEIIGEIGKSTSRIIKLSKEINRVLVLDKPNILMTFVKANVNDVAKDVMSRNRVKANEKMQNMYMKLDPQMEAIEIDVQKIDEIIDNVISNAIKFTHKRGNITLSTKMEKDRVIIEVNDDGLGLSDEDLTNLFSRGKKLSNVPTEGEDSTGFGLWIVKKLAEAHNGRVYVKSRVGVGSTFSISLPLSQYAEDAPD